MYAKFNLFAKPSYVYAVGDLTINWGIGIDNVGPIFNISNFAPGDEETRTVNIENTALISRAVAIRGIKTSGAGNLESSLEIVISDSSGDLYGGTNGTKTLEDFFNDTSSPLGVFLFDLAGGANQDIEIKIKFLAGAGNQYQDANVVFDVLIGITVDIPAECSDIVFDNVVFGTAGNDRLNGGAGSQLILGLEGNDRIDGGAGGDCIVGGLGNDNLEGGAGGDIIDGGEGNDKIEGGAEGDTIKGGSDNDNIRGGAGNDNILGEGDNDVIDGDAGADFIDGGDAHDILKGGAGGDTLIGGSGIDTANGQSGVDSCTAEVETSCEI